MVGSHAMEKALCEPYYVSEADCEVEVLHGGAALPARRRPRACIEPKLEREILSGASDIERDCALAPQLKRLRLSEIHGHADDDAMAVDLACGPASSTEVPQAGGSSMATVAGGDLHSTVGGVEACAPAQTTHSPADV